MSRLLLTNQGFLYIGYKFCVDSLRFIPYDTCAMNSPRNLPEILNKLIGGGLAFIISYIVTGIILFLFIVGTLLATLLF